MAKTSAARHKLAALKKDGYVRLYGPTSTKPEIWRVVCRRPSHPPTERTASSLDDAVRIYDLLVAWDRAQLPVAPRRGVGARNYDVNFLAARAVGFLRTNGRAARYCDKVEDTLGLHVIPLIGGVLVSDWSQDHCVAVMDAARKKGLGPNSVQDVGAAMRAMVTAAQRKPRLLTPGDDPMEGVSYAARSTIQGQSASFVPATLRPSTAAVLETAAFLDARGERLGRAWLGLPGRIMGFGGCRLGEVLALRPCDIEGTRIEISGTIESRHRPGSSPTRKGTKNRKSRSTVIGRELAKLLAVRAEQVRKEHGDMAPLFPDDRGRWMSTGCFSSMAALPARAAGVWEKGIPWENHRHHCATWWHEKGIPIETISLMLGHHDVAFTYATYFRSSADALAKAEVLLLD